ncbi:MAG: aminoglycoside phosphotransferase (APT) family kinase protein [Cyclobacteriaceae bacterium]|jgi:aminoglycoside phosphotransferase (APT) family kinase protein
MNIEASVIGSYITQKLPDFTGIPEIIQFKGGASNLTFLLTFDNNSKLVLRMPPPGKKAKSAHNMEREWRIASALSGHFPVPKMMLFEHSAELMGDQFYLMEYLSGNIPRKNLSKKIKPTEDLYPDLCNSYITTLTKLHQLDYAALGLQDFYKGDGYVKRQVDGWSKRMADAITPGCRGWEEIATWLDSNQPQDQPPCIIHNDYRFDNLVFDPLQASQIIGVLDWELSTVGDPYMEVGSSLAYWIEGNDPLSMKMLRRQPTHVKGMLSRDELLQLYFESAGKKRVDFMFYYIFGLFRLAVIAQQIYYRFHHKQSKNRSFAVFGPAVQLLIKYCSMLIRSNSHSISQKPLKKMDDLYYSLRIIFQTLK